MKKYANGYLSDGPSQCPMVVVNNTGQNNRRRNNSRNDYRITGWRETT